MHFHLYPFALEFLQDPDDVVEQVQAMTWKIKFLLKVQELEQAGLATLREQWDCLFEHFTREEVREFGKPISEDLAPTGTEVVWLAMWFCQQDVVESNPISGPLDPWIIDILWLFLCCYM